MSEFTPLSGVTPALRAQLGVPREARSEEAELYLRYVRALALLSECAPYVDEPDYAELIEALLRDAQERYPLEVRRNGERWEIAPRGV